MRDRPCNLRAMCGHDLRRVQWSPEDIARAEGLVAEFGGILSHYIGSHGAGPGVEWFDESGEHIVIEGSDVSSVLAILSAMLRDCDEGHQSGDFSTVLT
jgi:hypothetical protein